MIATISIGASTYSVYALSTNVLTDANAFFLSQLGAAPAAWNAANSNDRKRALVMGAEWMDRVLDYSGSPTAAGQPRDWPRDGATCDGAALGDAAVPDQLAYAEFWLAGLLLQDPAQASSSGTGQNVRRVQAGSASVEFFIPTIGSRADLRIPQPAWDTILCLLSSSSGASIPTVSGTDVESSFGPCDFDRLEGFS